MNDSVKPEWMRKKQAEQEAASKAEELRHERIVAASFLIEREGPKFWKELKDKLTTAVEFLPDLKLAGSIAAISGGNAIRVSIHDPRVFAGQTYTDLVCDLDNKEIRCAMLNGGIYSLHFCVTPGNVAVTRLQRESKAMDPAAASQYILEAMISRIEKQSK